jgi:hypothetical protein
MKQWPMDPLDPNQTSGIWNYLSLLLGVYLDFIEKSSDPAKLAYSSMLVFLSNVGAVLGWLYYGVPGSMGAAVLSALVAGMMLSLRSATVRRLLKRENSRATDTPRRPRAR